MEKIDEDYFLKIGEISKEFNLEPHVLRYWEKEFKSLKPKKTSKGQRIYNKKNIELVRNIKELLYERKYTIDGARKLIEGENKVFSTPSINSVPDKNSSITSVTKELNEILTLLNRKI
ncbi:MAG: MerR family transcriptional regulator [Nitrospinae bacterium]|nr:MerR family transcriptional regulator [Nitrospinota bacterium]